MPQNFTHRLHLVARERTGLITDGRRFVSGSWRINLDKARKVSTICLHESQDQASYFTARVERVLLNPDDGRIVFEGEVTPDAPPRAVEGWGNEACWLLDVHPISRSFSSSTVRTLVRIGVMVAGADGLSPREKYALQSFAADALGMSPEAFASAVGTAGSLDDNEVGAAAEELGPEMVRRALDIVEQVATMDGRLSKRELEALRKVRGMMHGGA